MGPGWTHALRFPAGTRLRFTRTLAAPLRAAIERESPQASAWLAAIDGAIATIESIDTTRCAVRIDAPAGRATVECSPAANATFDVHARLQHGSDLYARALSDVVIMLGGTNDVYAAERANGGTRQLIRVRYEPNFARAELAVFTAPFASQLSGAMRAMLPSLIVVGRLDILAGEAVA